MFSHASIKEKLELIINKGEELKNIMKLNELDLELKEWKYSVCNVLTSILSTNKFEMDFFSAYNEPQPRPGNVFSEERVTLPYLQNQLIEELRRLHSILENLVHYFNKPIGSHGQTTFKLPISQIFNVNGQVNMAQGYNSNATSNHVDNSISIRVKVGNTEQFVAALRQLKVSEHDISEFQAISQEAPDRKRNVLAWFGDLTNTYILYNKNYDL